MRNSPARSQPTSSGVINLPGCHIVELSHVLVPFEEEYKTEVRNRSVPDLQPYYRDKVAPEAWYIMSEVEFWSHTGTHMEAPFHYIQDGIDISQLPLDRLVGEALVIDFTDKGFGEEITRSELEERGADVRDGDIVFIRTGLSRNYRTELSHDRPYLAEEAVEWLVERRIGCLGIDASGIENRTLPRQPNHQLLLSNGIPLIEHLTNLDQLRQRRFFVVAVPWRVRGLEAAPVSVVAIELARA